MAANDVFMNLFADTSKATKSIEKFSGQSAKSLEGVENSFKALKVVAGAAVAVFAGSALIGGLKKITDAAAVQETAINDLNTALRTSGEYSEAASQDMQAYASTLQENTTYGDELVLSQLALAKAFGATNAQAKDVVTAATELAAATGKSLNEATAQVSKTLGGFAGELGEVNPKIKALTVEQLKAGEAAKILIEQYGGTAASKLKTFAGIVESTNNVWEDLLGIFGQLITKNAAVIKAIEGLRTFLSNLIQIVKDNEEAFSGLVTMLAEGFLESLRWLGNIMPTVVSYMAAFAQVITAIDWKELAKGATTFAAVWYGAKGLLYAFQNGTALVAGLASKFTIYIVAVLALAAAVDLLRANWRKLTTGFESLNLDLRIKQQEALVNNMKEGVQLFGFEIQAPMPDKVAQTQRVLNELIAKKKELDGVYDTTGWSGGFLGELKKIADGLTDPLGGKKIKLPELESIKVNGIDLPQSEIDKLKVNVEKVQDKGFLNFGRALAVPIFSWINAIDDFTGAIFDNTESNGKAGKELGVMLMGIADSFIQISGTVLKGRQGAKDVVGAGVNMVGTALGGSAVGDMAQALITPFMEGPDFVKDMVTEFANSLPDIIVNVIEGIVMFMDTIVEALVVSLIDNGGLERIVIALAKAAPKIGVMIAFGLAGYLGGRLFLSIIKRMGFDIGRNIGQEFLNWIAKLQIVEELKMIFGGLANSLADFFNIVQQMGDYLMTFQIATEKISEAFQWYVTAISEAYTQIFEWLTSAWTAIYEKAREIFDWYIQGYTLIYEAVRSLIEALPAFFSKMGQDLKDIFKLKIAAPSWLSKLRLKTPSWLTRLFNIVQVTPGWVTWLNDIFDWFLDNLFGWADGLSFGSGNSLNPANWFRNGGVVYAANGMAPRGRDNIPAMLSAGERVLSTEQNNAFEDMPILLSQIVQLLSKDQTVKSTVEINGRQFANIILDLSRRNERLTA